MTIGPCLLAYTRIRPSLALRDEVLVCVAWQHSQEHDAVGLDVDNSGDSWVSVFVTYDHVTAGFDDCSPRDVLEAGTGQALSVETVESTQRSHRRLSVTPPFSQRRRVWAAASSSSSSSCDCMRRVGIIPDAGGGS